MGLEQTKKVWLVTGSSSGLGRSFVKALAEQGNFVAATARNKDTLRDLEQQYPGQILALTLDVTQKDQISIGLSAYG